MKNKSFLNPSSSLLRYRNFPNLGKSLDLATEAHSLLRGDADMEIPGVKEDVEHYPQAKITTISILNPQGEELMGKKMGHYINIEIPHLAHEREEIKPISGLVAEKLRQLIPPQGSGCIMMIGLGNNQATPDALGPRVVDLTLATRHIQRHVPEEMPPNMESVCIMAPGVLGITGIETAEMIKGAVEHVKPRCLLVVDALAAGDIARVGTTIQIADTGINPGSGVGNKRLPVNEETMGIPVIAIGVPTVVNTKVIIYDTVLNVLELWQRRQHKTLPQMDENTMNQISEKLLAAFDGNLIVTPREIDALIEAMAEVIAASFAQAVHTGVDEENYHLYLR